MDIGPSGGDDTGAIQGLMDTLHKSRGGRLDLWDAVYLFRNLRYYSDVWLAGQGMGVGGTVMMQIAGTADAFLKSADPTLPCHNLMVTDMLWTAYRNPANLGGLLLEATSMSRLERVGLTYTQGFAAKVLGGRQQGDAMHNTITGYQIQNLRSGNAIQLTPQAQGGSHPDGTKILDGLINSAVGTGIKIDPAVVDQPRALAPDTARITGNNIQEVPIPLDLAGQDHRVTDNRLEVTGPGGMTVRVRKGTVNCPTYRVAFRGTVYAAGAGGLTFIDEGSATVRDDPLKAVA